MIYKLLGFTLAMIVGPIGTYFLTVDHVFGGTFMSSTAQARDSDATKATQRMRELRQRSWQMWCWWAMSLWQ